MEVGVMEPYFTLDINDDSNPQFQTKYTINSTLQDLNEAANRAELVSIDPKLPNLYLYDILRIISKYTAKPNIIWWAKSLGLYHRLWVTRSVQEYPNALILGATLCIDNSSLDLRVLAFLFGMNMEVVQDVVQRVKDASASGQVEKSYTAEHYFDLACGYFGLDQETSEIAQGYLETIEQSVQLLPVGSIEPQWLACLSVFFAGLANDTPLDAIKCAQAASIPLAKFTDLCDYIWCDRPQLASAHQRQRFWYFDQPANINTVVWLCEYCGVDPDIATKCASLVPQGLFKNGKSFVALALLRALDISVPEDVSSTVLNTANRSPKQLDTWTRQVKQYLR